MRVKKYQREIEQYEKKLKDRQESGAKEQSHVALEKKLNEKQEVIRRLQKENQMIINIYEETEKEVKKVNELLSELQAEVHELKKDMRTLKNAAPAKKEESPENPKHLEMLELKQQLMSVQHLLSNLQPEQPQATATPKHPSTTASPISLSPNTAPTPPAKRKQELTFRDLQRGGAERPSNNKSDKPTPFLTQLNSNQNKNSFPFIGAETTLNDERKEVIEPSKQVGKENAVLAALSFLKKKKE